VSRKRLQDGKLDHLRSGKSKAIHHAERIVPDLQTGKRRAVATVLISHPIRAVGTVSSKIQTLRVISRTIFCSTPVNGRKGLLSGTPKPACVKRRRHGGEANKAKQQELNRKKQ
jgi:hypothetical protein